MFDEAKLITTLSKGLIYADAPDCREWWLRTPVEIANGEVSEEPVFKIVDRNGSFKYVDIATESLGVVPGFCV